MGKFRLAVGLHNHQPVGNFESVFEQAHQQAYNAFLELFSKYKSLRISLHQSGILWRWQERHHPEYFDLVRKLVAAGRIELMTGGFYEPILIAIPERDAIAQITMLNEYLEKHFGTTPNGLWLTERIWEPHLPSLLSKAGIEYLPVDDTHFIYSGFEHNQLTGPFITENNGDRVTLLPIQKSLRYLIPFGDVDEVMDELKRQAQSDPDGLAIYADDGEKFGVIEANADWLEVVPLSEAAASESVGRAYLPSASYEEMLHWALPAKAFAEYEEFKHLLKEEGHQARFGRFVRGGHWRGFMVKYEEANLMHKKMLAVSIRFDRIVRTVGKVDLRLKSAGEHLFAGQCNCPYWHGVFGGLYLPHIRQAVYSNLIEADRILDTYDVTNPVDITVDDYDADGYNEIVVKNAALAGVVKPSRGGTLHELSIGDPAFNLTDTLTRRIEGYHAKLARARLADAEVAEDETASIHDLVLTKEEGLQQLLVEDWYLKRCFIDHFVVGHIGFASFKAGKIGDEGDFVLEPYDVLSKGDNGSILLRRKGHIWRGDGAIPIEVEKQFRLLPGDHFLDVSYRLSAPGSNRPNVRFAVENNFNFQAGHAPDRFVIVDGARADASWLDSDGEYKRASRWSMVDEYRGIGVGVLANRPGIVWHTPIYTVSLSEGGFEKVYQGTTFVNIFELVLTEEPTEISFRLYAGMLDRIPADMLIREAAKPRKTGARLS